mgnify:CR=1 FL=1
MVKNIDILKKNISITKDNLDVLVKSNLLNKIDKLSKIINNSLKRKKKILFCGNGGSASEASHIAAEFVGRYLKERGEQPAISLTSDNSIITAISNDYSFKEIFSKQIKAIGKDGDILIALSTSGKSKNIIEAIKSAKNKRMKTILFTGQKKFKYKKLIDIEINVPAKRVDRIQELHLVLLHNLCELVELKLR